MSLIFPDKTGSIAIEKLSAAITAIYAPQQSKRMAKAEAENILKLKKAQAIADLEVSEIHRLAEQRVAIQAAYHQLNLQAILMETASHMDESATPEKIEPDWMSNYLEKAKLTSDEEMQNLWGRILAGEANSPGTYSKRTVNFLSDMDKQDADSFQKMMRFSWIIRGQNPVIFATTADSIYVENGLTTRDLMHLEDIRLIQREPMQSYHFDFSEVQSGRLPCVYHGKRFYIDISKLPKFRLNVGQVALSSVGRELSKVCITEPIEGVFEYMEKKWDPFIAK